MKLEIYYIFRFLKKLDFTLFKKWGRDCFGHIVSYHRGNSIFKRYKVLNFFYNINSSGIVVDTFVYQSIFISFVVCFNGLIFYTLFKEGQKKGDIVFFGEDFSKSILNPFTNGSAFPLKYMLKNYLVSCLEIYPNSGSVLSRSSGNFSIILDNDLELNEVTLLLSSGWKVKISGNCYACLGQIGILNLNRKKNAGFNRRKGIRPTVRGVAMNPVDHPHGGGEGKTSGGRHPVSPWGKLTKGKLTVGKKKEFLKVPYKFLK